MPVEGQMEEDVEEVDKEIDVGEAPPTRESAAKQAPALLATLLVTAETWAGGRGDQVAGPATHQLEGPRQGARLYRQSSCPRPRWIKNWLAGSRWKKK